MIPKLQEREGVELLVCTRCKKSLPEESRFCPYCGKVLFPHKTKPRRPNGAGSVYKVNRPLARPWRARVTFGTSTYNVGYFETSAEAMKAIAVWDPPDSSEVRPEMTLADVYAAVMSGKSGSVSASSLDTYRAAWKQLEPLRNAQLVKLRPADYQKIIDGMKGYSRSACEKVRVLVSLIGRWAVQNGVLAVNPAKALTLPKKEKKPVRKRETFTADEIRTLWADGSEDALIVLAMIYTGMRINELFALTPSDVYTDGDIIYIIGGEKTDAGRDRVIALNDRISPVFLRWRDTGGKFLVQAERGGMMNARFFRVKKYYPLLERLGIEKINPHKARHTFASLAANAGAVPVALQKFLGHADFSTTANFYTHSDLADLKKVADLLP